MRRILILFLFLIFVPVCNAADFYGALFRFPVNKGVTVTWNAEEVTGYQVKMVHYFYGGLETVAVEVVEPLYTFSRFPRSSRHFEVQVRCFNETGGNRLYGDWAVSSNTACSLVVDSNSGWLIYTSPAAPVW